MNRIAPIRKSVRIECSVEETFRRFVDLDSWWPLATHSLGQHDAETCAIEARVGGRVYERQRNGVEKLWGTVLVWEPPRRIVLTWYPGRDEQTQQEVEIQFVPDGASTIVELEHRGWETLGEQGPKLREQYDGGWDTVLARFANSST